MPLDDTPLLNRDMREAVDVSTKLTRSSGAPQSSGWCCFKQEVDSADPEARLKSRNIDAHLRSEKANATEEIKLLLLGTGEAGKSTIFKQIQIIHNKGIPSSERGAVGEAIHQQILLSIHMMLRFCDENGIPLEAETSQLAAIVHEWDTMGFVLNPEKAGMLFKIWQDPGIQSSFERRGEYHLMDSTQYFFSKIDEIAKKGWAPNEQDVIHARIKTTGISEMSFTLRDYQFRVIDVGGQRSERRKWIHCFEDVTAVIFVVSLNEYDCTLCEDQTVNRMHESLSMFTEICNSPWFVKTSMILFLNKRDLFAEKIKRVDLNVCFPDYTGGCDETRALEFIQNKFQAANRNQQLKTIYSHVTCATDTGNIKFVFNSVQDIVLQENLRGSGII